MAKLLIVCHTNVKAYASGMQSCVDKNIKNIKMERAFYLGSCCSMLNEYCLKPCCVVAYGPEHILFTSQL